MSHRGMHGTWKIIGPRDVQLTISDGSTDVLRFDQTIQSYKSVRSVLHGQRIPK